MWHARSYIRFFSTANAGTDLYKNMVFHILHPRYHAAGDKASRGTGT
jgi:hypothetical protein